MIKYITLLKGNFRRQKVSIIGVFLIIFLVSLSMTTVLSIWENSNTYVDEEMNRLGYGDITYWVSNVGDIDRLLEDIEKVNGVKDVNIQSLIFADYNIGSMESDTRGQLLTHSLDTYNYKILNDDLSGYKNEKVDINTGEIYVSPSLISVYGIKLGDTIEFKIARQEENKKFTVKGFFEDPFMGSSMMEMKSFLICEEDINNIAKDISLANLRKVADNGAMIHINKDKDYDLTVTQLNSLLNDRTSLPTYMEFVYAKSTISGFMILLQNIFTGLLLIFVIVLVGISMIVLGHSITTTINQDYENMGILKTLGFTSSHLRKVQLLQYMISIIMGICLGVIVSFKCIKFVNNMTITSIGLLIPHNISAKLTITSLIFILCIFLIFIWLKTTKIEKIKPLHAIRVGRNNSKSKSTGKFSIHQKRISFWMALRQLIWGKKQYISTMIITVLLVAFLSMIGRMDEWLGSNGEGLMDSFSVSQHDIGFQVMSNSQNVNMKDVDETISSYAKILETYDLAMPSVMVDGINYTANVITEPGYFHILRGKTCNEGEVVLTEFVASDLGVDIGDSITVTNGSNKSHYVVSGIYECANSMGNNIGMSREGFLKISEDSPNIWCKHYILDNSSYNKEIMQILKNRYRGDIYVHDNTWSGLDGIVNAMHMLIILMYVIVVIFIFIVVILVGSKILYMEKKDFTIYKTLGFREIQLRISFALRFTLVTFLGGLIGIILSYIFTDLFVKNLLKLCGISDFNSSPSIIQIIIPLLMIMFIFSLFAYLSSSKIKKSDISSEIAK